MHRTSHPLIAVIAASLALATNAFAQEADETLPETVDPSDPTMMPTDPNAPADPGAPPMDTTDASAAAATGAIDEHKLDQFANAYLEVQQIQQRAESDMQSAADPAALDTVRTSAESEMISAVERSGLNVEEFNQIVETMASDLEVRDRVAAKLQERSGG